MIDTIKLWKVVLVSWFFTLMSLLSLLFITLLIGFLAIRFAGPRVVVVAFMTALALGTFVFLISEVLVNRLFRAEKPDPEKDRALIDIVKKIAQKKRMWITPRVYILDVGSPNAMAYGIGLPGLAAVGVSRELMDLLTTDELEGVIAHEIGHIRCRDIGVMTVIGLLHSLVARFSRLLRSGSSVWAQSVFLYAIVWIGLQIANGTFSLMRFAISQERELAADALGASYQGTPVHLMSALRKLHQSRQSKSRSRDLFDEQEVETNDPFSDIMISHPGLPERISSLESILVNQPQKEG